MKVAAGKRERKKLDSVGSREEKKMRKQELSVWARVDFFEEKRRGRGRKGKIRIFDVLTRKIISDGLTRKTELTNQNDVTLKTPLE